MKKILVANRGEIALRIMRSAKEMGIKTVAIFSEADRHSPHVHFADEAYLIGPPPSSQSYLQGDRIIQLCLDKQVDAIHPGYGFLSENSAFARKVTEAGITFIGPSPEAMDLMGSKLAAKAAVKEFGVPLVPGTAEAITDIAEAKRIAAEIGYPILIKASAGGGGKGMRTVDREEDFEEQMNRAVSEAENSFGDGRVFIEKFVGSPRHIEIQVLGDSLGNIIYLNERECSVQRRHQKVVEEAPSSVVTPEMRKAMGEAAVNVCKACNYTNAGTVEFLVDDTLNFYFLEMNTRLQVEHPVTEMITGLDLVKEQIRIARGESLSLRQKDVPIHGHAIELRVYAENPANNFLPDIGNLKVYRRPQGHGIRVDDGFEEGMDIPIYYDPMIAKLCVHGANRLEAVEKMRRAIAEYEIVGIETTLAFGDFVMRHPAFLSGDFDTNFVPLHFKPELLERPLDEIEAQIVALMGAKLFSDQTAPVAAVSQGSGGRSKWKLKRS
ncbi:MAG: acetyl-CoA carboxylase biotin carboxylase subunit [Bacteroidia bacterium]|nr:acetyl-CoA carboxylase biotin carboxylase subunit [Bacteroidia bacterium]